MMNIWIENESAGKFLYVERSSENTDFENGMLKSMTAECILYPAIVFKNGKSCFECNISGLVPFRDHMERHRFSAEELSSVLIQIGGAVNVMKNYLLSEDSLLLESENIYTDEKGNDLKFCVLPGNEKNFEDGLKKLITELLKHVDTESFEALRLGFRLFQAASEPDYRLHDLLEKITGYRSAELAVNEAGRKADTAAVFREPVTPGAPAAAADSVFGLPAGQRLFGQAEQRPIQESQMEQAAAERFRRDPEESAAWPDPAGYAGPDQEEPNGDPEDAEKESIFTTVRGWLISQAILCAGAGAVYLLKGASLTRKMLPFYLIFALCVTLYYVVEAVLRRKKDQAAEKL